MRSHLTTLSAVASLFALATAQAPAQNGATAVMTTITLTSIDTPPVSIEGVTYTGMATLYAGETLFSQSNTIYLVNQNGGRIDNGGGSGALTQDGITVSNGKFVTNGVDVPVVATQGAVPAASQSAPPAPSATTTTSHGTDMTMTMTMEASGAPAMTDVRTSSGRPAVTAANGTALLPAGMGTGTSSLPASSSGPAKNAGERVALGRVVAAVSVFIAALAAL